MDVDADYERLYGCCCVYLDLFSRSCVRDGWMKRSLFGGECSCHGHTGWAKVDQGRILWFELSMYVNDEVKRSSSWVSPTEGVKIKVKSTLTAQGIVLQSTSITCVSTPVNGPRPYKITQRNNAKTANDDTNDASMKGSGGGN